MTTASLPTGTSPPALTYPHFPDRLHAVVWRNWELIQPQKIACVLHATVAQITAIAESLGLPPEPFVSPHSPQRNYITIIRRNWHLLPYEQLLELLDWNAERMSYVLREDDFLFIKLGNLKPACPPVYYHDPDKQARDTAAKIQNSVAKHFSQALYRQGELPFQFLDDLTTRVAESHGNNTQSADTNPRFIYSYFALYGDPLLKSDCDPFPEGFLQRLRRLGVNGIWIQAVLAKLAYWSLFPQLSEKYQKRLSNLKNLVARAAEHGIGVYLYLNEPRSLTTDHLQRHPGLQGVQDRGDPDYWALCSSAPEVQSFVTESTESIFRAVPDLAGVFSITMSENLTNCHSRGYGEECRRCGKRKPAEVVAEVNRLIAEGAWRAKAEARVIAWDWGWGSEWAEEAIGLLPDGMWLMSVSEWDLPIERGGVASQVGEYCLSAPGPGPRARRHWQAAKRRGLKTIAKMQINNTWELASVPYLPVMDLLAETLGNLSQESVDGMMLSWTLGGYPSENLELTRHYCIKSCPDRSQVLRQIAVGRFGEDGAVAVLDGWREFSAAFREYPFHIGSVYHGPQHAGPANLLYAQPTGYKATMTGIAYDDIDTWRSVYPAQVYLDQFRKLAEKWQNGVRHLRAALPAERSAPALKAELRIAEACLAHWQSVANQAEFVLKRATLQQCRDLLQDEITIAKRMFHIVNSDSRIGFEASNHYFYTRLDFVEKAINCSHLLSTLD